MSGTQSLTLFIQTHFDHIVRHWQDSLLSTWTNAHNTSQQINLERHCVSLLKGFVSALDNAQTPTAHQELVTLLSDVGAIWAKKGISASQTSNFIIKLKQTLLSVLQSETQQNTTDNSLAMFLYAQEQLDDLLLVCHEAFTTSREKLIKQQSAALLELSSPVVKMWNKTLLVPLIGVIDTSRAKQITESLLTEITEQEATVTVLDLTGVPVFDTAVAGHLIKTINAARMLGCQIIMTGISPEGALVLTKLGVEFKDVITRGNLHSGVKAAFSLQGLNITSAEAA